MVKGRNRWKRRSAKISPSPGTLKTSVNLPSLPALVRVCAAGVPRRPPPPWRAGGRAVRRDVRGPGPPQRRHLRQEETEQHLLLPLRARDQERDVRRPGRGEHSQQPIVRLGSAPSIYSNLRSDCRDIIYYWHSCLDCGNIRKIEYR